MNTLKLFGPPGTGKTTALLNHMERELEAGVRPDRLAYLTFTVRARSEAIERAQERFGFSEDDLPFFRTLHSIAYRQLGMISAAMVRDDELAEFAARMGTTFSSVSTQPAEGLAPSGNGKGDLLMAFDHFRRHRCQTIEEAWREWKEDMNWFVVNRFCRAYHRWKRDEGLHDFTDLLELPHEPLPVDVVMVDEAQDLSLLQWRTLDRFAADAERVYIAGDDDQAIFTWAGASPQELLRRPGKVEVLHHSYRLSKAVHGEAEKMISQVQVRQPKSFEPRDEDGEFDLVMDPDYISVDSSRGSWLLLYRNHYLGKPFEDKLRREGVPYSKADRPAPGSQWGPAIVYWERLRKGKLLTPAEVNEVYTAMVPGGASLGKYGRERLRGAEEPLDLETLRRAFALKTTKPWYDALDAVDARELEYLRRVIQNHGSGALMGTPPVKLSTIHAAKGSEADHVILLTEVSRVVRDTIGRHPDSERRVFYVGITRARHSLTQVGVHNPLFN